ncbi:MAG: hypothetical protein ACREJ2_19155 [Planctomycetota bacterium]
MASKPIQYRKIRFKTRVREMLADAVEQFGGEDCDPRFVEKFGDGSRTTFILARTEIVDEESFDIKTLQPVERRRKQIRVCEFTLDFENGLLETTRRSDAQVIIGFLHEVCPGQIEVEELEVNVPEIVLTLEKQNALKSIEQLSIKNWQVKEGRLKSANLAPESAGVARELLKDESLEFTRSALALGQPVFNAKLKVSHDCTFSIATEDPEPIEQMVRTLIRQFAFTARDKEDGNAPTVELAPTVEGAEEPAVRAMTRSPRRRPAAGGGGARGAKRAH